MLSNEDWVRLIDGLNAATRDGRLRWTEEPYFASALGLSVSLSRLMSPRRLIAERPSARYTMAAGESGLAPYELRVFERDKKREWVEVDAVSSSTRVYGNSNYSVNSALEALYRSIDSTVEAGEKIVDRLLDDLQSDAPRPPLPRVVPRDPEDPNPLTQKF